MRAVASHFTFFVVSALLLSVSVGHAIPSPLQVRPGRVTPPIQAGAVTGGIAGAEFSLINVTRELAGGGAERLILSYGDQTGQPVKADPGYFHVSIDRGGKRIVIDLAQVSRTAVQPSQLAKVLAGSHLVASSEMSMDPHDHSTNITLQMRTRVAIKVAPDGANTGRLGLEMHPIHLNPSPRGRP